LELADDRRKIKILLD